MIGYFKLLDHLNRIGIGKEEFRKRVKISPGTMAKISKNEYVSLEVIDRICEELDCQPGDIIEYYEDVYNKNRNKNTKIAVQKEPLDVDREREIISIRDIDDVAKG